MESSALTRDKIKSFILHCKSKGLSDKTIATYEQHFSAMEKHIDLDKPIDYLCKTDFEIMIAAMRELSSASLPIVWNDRNKRRWCNTVLDIRR